MEEAKKRRGWWIVMSWWKLPSAANTGPAADRKRTHFGQIPRRIHRVYDKAGNGRK
jgi:hypothetical protein